MDLQLKDVLVVVTASTGDGIGKAIATEFARHGAHVVVNGRSASSVEATVNDICGSNVDVVVKDLCLESSGTITAAATVRTPNKDHLHGVVGSAATAQGCADLIREIEAIEERLGLPVQVLVNNLGIFHVQDFEQVTDEKWMEYYETNTLSGVRLSRHFLPKMKEQAQPGKKRHGRILFISSECGLRPLPHMVPYSVSKTSQISLARALAETTKDCNGDVTVNSILPGPTMTQGVRDYMKGFCEKHKISSLEEGIRQYFAEHERTSLIQRFLDPQEIANVAVFLASPLASGINGVAQHVDGGIVHHL
mmetsp:Transcript_28234/g.77530  ORF Transcript_28234/g.77530 Transcript_28234/m.77530 type:complete len:307 (-) Transcript_28234:98-1018(-)